MEKYKDLIGDSIVRGNLLSNINYRPYCGNVTLHYKQICNNPKTEYKSIYSQFICPNCGWISQFPEDFMKAYKEVHNLSTNNL